MLAQKKRSQQEQERDVGADTPRPSPAREPQETPAARQAPVPGGKKKARVIEDEEAEGDADTSPAEQDAEMRDPGRLHRVRGPHPPPKGKRDEPQTQRQLPDQQDPWQVRDPWQRGFDGRAPVGAASSSGSGRPKLSEAPPTEADLDRMHLRHKQQGPRKKRRRGRSQRRGDRKGQTQEPAGNPYERKFSKGAEPY